MQAEKLQKFSEVAFTFARISKACGDVLEVPVGTCFSGYSILRKSMVYWVTEVYVAIVIIIPHWLSPDEDLKMSDFHVSVWSDFPEMLRLIFFIPGIGIKYNRGLMHIKQILAQCPNMAVVDVLRYFCHSA